MKSMCCLYIQFTHENNSERTILHLVKKKNFVWLLALQKRLATPLPNIIDLSRKKQLFDLGVKGQGPTKVIMVRNTPPYGHAPTHQISLTYLKRQKCYGPDKKILFKKQLFDLEVKGQGPMKVIMVCDTPPYGHAPTYQISLTYLVRNNYLTLRSKVKVPRRSLWYVTHSLMVMHPHTKYH